LLCIAPCGVDSSKTQIMLLIAFGKICFEIHKGMLHFLCFVSVSLAHIPFPGILCLGLFFVPLSPIDRGLHVLIGQTDTEDERVEKN
jgi:hypothetical protein